MSDRTNEILKVFVAPIIVSVLVGFGSGWLGAAADRAVTAERVDSHEKRITSLEAKESDTRDRLVRLETKIDLLLMRDDP